MCITVWGNYDDLINEQYNIESLFKECGYFLIYEETIVDNKKYIKLYFEPYKPNISIVRVPPIIYNFSINTDITVLKFFMGNDVSNIKKYIIDNNSEFCLKIQVPTNIVFFIDTSLIHNNIIDLIYTYDNIDSTYIINKIKLIKNNIFLRI